MKHVDCARCHLNRPHHAKDLCVDCYHIVHVRNPAKGFCLDRKCTRVQPVPIIARGLCQQCYSRNHNAGTLGSFRVMVHSERWGKPSAEYTQRKRLGLEDPASL